MVCGLMITQVGNGHDVANSRDVAAASKHFSVIEKNRLILANFKSNSCEHGGATAAANMSGRYLVVFIPRERDQLKASHRP